MRKNYTNTARFLSIGSAMTLATMSLFSDAQNPIVWLAVVILVGSTGYWIAKDDIA